MQCQPVRSCPNQLNKVSRTRSGVGRKPGLLATGNLSALALPLSAVRTDKPAPYVQMLDGDRVRHVPVVLGARGESNQQTMVAVNGLPEGAQVLIGGVGPMQADTVVSLNGGAK
jgi:hypothetical protein